MWNNKHNYWISRLNTTSRMWNNNSQMSISMGKMMVNQWSLRFFWSMFFDKPHLIIQIPIRNYSCRICEKKPDHLIFGRIIGSLRSPFLRFRSCSIPCFVPDIHLLALRCLCETNPLQSVVVENMFRQLIHMAPISLKCLSSASCETRSFCPSMPDTAKQILRSNPQTWLALQQTNF